MTDRVCYAYTAGFLDYLAGRGEIARRGPGGARRGPATLDAADHACLRAGDPRPRLRAGELRIHPDAGRDLLGDGAGDRQHHGHRQPHPRRPQRHQVQPAGGGDPQGGRGGDQGRRRRGCPTLFDDAGALRRARGPAARRSRRRAPPMSRATSTSCPPGCLRRPARRGLRALERRARHPRRGPRGPRGRGDPPRAVRSGSSRSTPRRCGPRTRRSRAPGPREHGFFALCSADGDGDRPLIADERGAILRGDVAGILAAGWLGADTVVTPVSSNTAAEGCGWFARVVRTRIGSPYVIAAMQAAAGAGSSATRPTAASSPSRRSSGTAAGSPPLPTRDAADRGAGAAAPRRGARGRPCPGSPGSCPPRFTASDRLTAFPTELSSAPASARCAQGGAAAVAAVFGADFGAVASLDETDGLRDHLRERRNRPPPPLRQRARTALLQRGRQPRARGGDEPPLPRNPRRLAHSVNLGGFASTVHRWAKGWRGGVARRGGLQRRNEVSARSGGIKHDGGPQRQDPAARTGTACSVADDLAEIADRLVQTLGELRLRLPAEFPRASAMSGLRWRGSSAGAACGRSRSSRRSGRALVPPAPGS